jgi:hypothetical protein
LIEATILEDYGNLGTGGRRLYRLRFTVDDVSGEMYAVRTAEQLTLVAPAPEPARPPRKKKHPRG